MREKKRKMKFKTLLINQHHPSCMRKKKKEILQDAREKNCTTLNQKLYIISTTANQREYFGEWNTGKKNLFHISAQKNNDLIFVLLFSPKKNTTATTNRWLFVCTNVSDEEWEAQKERKKKLFWSGQNKIT